MASTRMSQAEQLFMEARSMQAESAFEDATATLFDVCQLLMAELQENNTNLAAESTTDDDYWKSFLLKEQNTSLDTIFVSSVVKSSIKDAILLPLFFDVPYSVGANPKKALLLSGVNGTGKTSLVKAIATTAWKELQVPMLCVPSGALLSKWIGSSEKLVEGLFTYAEKNKPIILFFDEVDSVFSSKNEKESDTMTRVKNIFLQKMSGITALGKGITIIACTNAPYKLDVSFQSRFDKEFNIPLPSARQRKLILEHRLKGMTHGLLDRDLALIASLTSGYSGRDLEHVLSHAQDLQYHDVTLATHFQIQEAVGPNGTPLILSAHPVSKANPSGEERKWTELRNVVIPRPIMLKDMLDSVTFCNRTTSEIEMLELDAYYEEKRVHRYFDDEASEGKKFSSKSRARILVCAFCTVLVFFALFIVVYETLRKN